MRWNETKNYNWSSTTVDSSKNSYTRWARSLQLPSLWILKLLIMSKSSWNFNDTNSAQEYLGLFTSLNYLITFNKWRLSSYRVDWGPEWRRLWWVFQMRRTAWELQMRLANKYSCVCQFWKMRALIQSTNLPSSRSLVVVKGTEWQ